jgi:predicted RNA-binding protein (virulence factor B family)
VIEVGKYNRLKIARESEFGLYLADEDNMEVLLPNKYKPKDYKLNDEINVFVYRDSESRKVATTLKPKATLHDFAFLEVISVTPIGAFLDWGLEKDLFAPFNEQMNEMAVGNRFVFYVNKDEETDNLYATNKIKPFLNRERIRLNHSEKVDIMVYSESELGYSVIVNRAYHGLVYKNEVFKELKVGDELKAYVKKLGENDRIDISIEPLGYRNFNDKNCEIVYKALQGSNGMIFLSDKSTPEEIYAQFGISKKAFKKAIGALYQERKIVIGKESIKLV